MKTSSAEKNWSEQISQAEKAFTLLFLNGEIYLDGELTTAARRRLQKQIESKRFLSVHGAITGIGPHSFRLRTGTTVRDSVENLIVSFIWFGWFLKRWLVWFGSTRLFP